MKRSFFNLNAVKVAMPAFLFLAQAGFGQVTGSGTTGFLGRWTGTSSLGNSLIYDNNNSSSPFLSFNGGTSPLSGESFLFKMNGAGASMIRVYNPYTAAGASANITMTNANNGISVTSYNSSYSSSGIFEHDKGVINTNGSAGMNIGTTVSSPLCFWTNNTQKMTLSSAGNLSIGNTNNTYPLDVTGVINSNTTFRSGNATNYVNMGWDGNHSSIISAGTNLLLNWNNSGNGKDVEICTGGSGAYVVTGNNVEVGGPTRDVNTAMNIKLNGSMTNGLKVSNSSGTEKMKVTSAGDIFLDHARLILSGSGDPSHGIGLYSTFAGKTPGGPVVHGWNGGALGSDQTITGGSQQIALTWDATGKVHVGTTVPTAAPYSGAKFTVDGTIAVKEIYVVTTSGTWADYVFKKDYKLMPLQEIEKFVSTNQHLPNIPSAQEIESGGQNIGQLQAVQMEKIEELYLHMIEMNKKILKLEEENANLKSQVSKMEESK